MTLPTEWIFPLNEERLHEGSVGEVGDYVEELVTTVSSMYQDVAQAVNGDIKQFVPKVLGTTIPGDVTYTIQDGWVLRQGLMVDVWFIVQWTSHTGTGNAYIQLPYKVKKSISYPFVGQLNGHYAYSAPYTGMFTIAIPDTFTNTLFAEGPSTAPVDLGVLPSGTLFGHVRYIGQEIEN